MLLLRMNLGPNGSVIQTSSIMDHNFWCPMDFESSSLMGFLNLLDLPFGDKYKAAFSRVLQKLYIKVIISTWLQIV